MPSKQRSGLRCGLFLLVLLFASMGPGPGLWAEGKMGAVLQKAASPDSDAESLQSIPAVFFQQGEPHVKLHMKLSDIPPEFDQAGVELGSSAGDIYTATVPVTKLSEVADMPQVVRMEAAQRGRHHLEISVPDISADEVWTNGQWGNQGEGVLVGMVDSGILYQHEAFLDDDGNNRILYILDNSTNPPTECDPASIQDESCSQTDNDGHGTAVMGVIAGAGSAECAGSTDPCEGRGVAPRANMVVVKSPGLLSTEVIDGVAYIFQKAQELNMPAVVNLSLGFFSGPRDGTSMIEESISNLTGPGKIVVAAAGNEALMRGHAEASIDPGGDAFVFAFIGLVGTTLGQAVIEGWYDARQDAPNDLQAKVWAFDQELTGWVAFGGEESVQSEQGDVTVTHFGTTSTARGFEVRIEDAAPIEWRIQLRRVGQGQGTTNVDLWIHPTTFPEPDLGEPPVFRFTTVHQDEWERTTLTPPCTAENVICVTSYNTDCDVPGYIFCEGPGDTEQGISSFSSQGPRRDGRIGWPWITAPGQAVITALNDLQVKYSPQRGTSFASPHVAGTVALMYGASLDTAFTYSVADIKDFIKDSAREEGSRDVWGWGKVNASGAVAELFATLPPPPPPVPQGLGEGDDICFIATAAFGNVDAPQVRLLREMRDRALMKTSHGRELVRLYYRWSPPAAAWLKEHGAASRLVRACLLPAVGWSEMVYHRSRVERAALFCLALSLAGAVCYLSVRRRVR